MIGNDSRSYMIYVNMADSGFQGMTGKYIVLAQRFIFSITLMISSLGWAADGTARDETGKISLSELASQADLVAVAQVVDTDYIYTRSFPSEGTAILKVLISYKANRAGEEFIEVYEKGLHPNECYFESPEFFLEGRRYLVFFSIDPVDPELYRGLPQGCALEILVTEDSTYALKYPVEGILLEDQFDGLATEYGFRDPHALVDEESLSPANRDKLLARRLIVPYEDHFKYTHGVDLTSVRKLIGSDALEVKSQFKR